jgi:hypothetical protein
MLECNRGDSMSRSFEELKEKFHKDSRKEYFEKIYEYMEEIEEGVDGEWSNSSKKGGLKYLRNRNKELSVKIEKCGRGKYCSSIYCLDCSRRISGKLYGRWIKEVENGYNLYSSTILNGLCELSIEGVKGKLKEFRSKIELCRKSNNNFYIDGIVELEVINKEKLYSTTTIKNELERRKVEYLKRCIEEMELKENYNSKTNLYILPHIHSVLRGGVISKEGYGRIIRKYFKRSWEVNIKNIPFKNQSVEVGVKKWSEYICKISTHNISYRSDLYSFKTTFKSENDMKRDLLEESYRLSYSIISKMMIVYNEVKGDNNKGLIIKSGK